MDYCAHGSLRDLMDQMDQPLEERVVAHVLRGALTGLAYLHSKKIIHRDIKAANILLDANGTPKLADFGVSRQMASTWAKTMSIAGTPLWMAPEVARMESYTYSVCLLLSQRGFVLDVFSLTPNEHRLTSGRWESRRLSLPSSTRRTRRRRR